MALTVLLEARPMRAADAAPVVVQLAGLGSRPYTHAGINDWWAGLTDAPRFSTALAFGQSGWTGGAVPTTGAIGFAPSDRARIDALAALVWDDAPVTIWTGDDAAAEPVWTVALDGVVAGIATRDGVLTMTVADLSKKLARPIAADRFTGKGGIEGGSDAAERLKRRSFGRCWGVEARLLDKAANIFEVGDPARPMLAIDAVKDRGRAASAITVIAWAGSIAATLDSLKAAAVPQGGAAVAPSIACVKWWTQPSGPLTVDLRGEVGAGYVETVAQIAARIADGAGLPTLNVAAAVEIRPGAAGLHVDSDSETAGQALDRLLLRASLLWLLEPAGAIRLLPIGFDAAGPVVEAVDASREASYKPVTRVVLGYQRNHRPHNAGEISAVFQASDGTYADGTPIEELKPATRGADVTSSNTAAGIFGQGAFATQSLLSLDNGSFFTLPERLLASGFGPAFLRAGSIAFLAGNSVEGLRPGEAGANVTEGRVAAAFLGQGVLATLSSLSRTGGLLTGFGGLAGSDLARLGSTIADSFGSVLFNGDVITGQGTAAAIAGQGALATRNAASWLTQVVGRPMNVGNLVNRPSFADGSRGDWGAHGATTVVDVAGQTFAKAGRSTLRDTLEGGNTIPVAVGEVLYFDVWLNADESEVGVGAGVFVFDKTGGIVGFPLPVSVPAGSGWARRASRYVVEPGVVSVQPWVQCNYDGSGTSAAKWADFQLTRAQLGATVGGRLGVDVLREGGTIATDAGLVTALGVASAILGQGPFATRADGLINSTEVIKQGDAFLSQRWPEEGGSNRTETRTAGGIAGQGTLATRNSIAYGGGLLTDFPTALAPSNMRGDGYLDFFFIKDYSGVQLSQRWPEEGGSNRTEGRTAAAIVGQGWAATQSEAATSNSRVPVGANAVTDSGFARGMAFFDQTGGVVGLNLGGYWGRRQVGYIHRAGAFAPGDTMDVSQLGRWGERGSNDAMRRYLLPVRQGDRVGARTLAAHHRARATLFLLLFDKDGTFIFAQPTSVGSYEGGAAGGEAMGEMTIILDIGHPDAAYAGWMLRGDGLPGGSTDPFVFFAEPWLGKLAPGQAVLPPYSVGPADVLGDRTLDNTAAAIAGQGALATQGAVRYADQIGGLPAAIGADAFFDGGRLLYASRVVYDDAGVVSAYRPEEAGGNRTEGRVASAVFGQGALATMSSLSRTSGYLSGFGGLSGFDHVKLGTSDARGFGLITEGGFGTSDASLVTDRGTAAAIAGQGALATQSGVSYRTQVADLPVALTQGQGLGIRADGTADPFFSTWNDGVRVSDRQPGEANANRTEGRTAAAIAGQGALATNNTIHHDGQLDGQIRNRLTPSPADGNFLGAGRIAWDEGNTVQNLKPGEGGANRTEGRTAAAIAGQGALATSNAISDDSQLSGNMATRLTPYANDPRFLRAGHVAWDGGDTVQNLKPGEGGANRTEGRTAAAVAGQGSLATRNGLGMNEIGDPWAGYIRYDNGASGTSVQSLRPEEAGGNRTEVRTASAIAGQGAFATAPQIGSWNVASYYNFSAFKLDYSITRSDGVSIVTEALSITQYGVAAAFAGQGTLATKNQAGAGDLAPSAVQQLAYTVLQQTITCAIGN